MKEIFRSCSIDLQDILWRKSIVYIIIVAVIIAVIVCITSEAVITLVFAVVVSFGDFLFNFHR